MTNSTHYSTIEKLAIHLNQAETNKIFSRLTGFFEQVTKSLLGCDELRIWVTSDKSGNKNWHAYDPVTGRYITVDSETEMQAWIEKRYHQ